MLLISYNIEMKLDHIAWLADLREDGKQCQIALEGLRKIIILMLPKALK